MGCVSLQGGHTSSFTVANAPTALLRHCSNRRIGWLSEQSSGQMFRGVRALRGGGGRELAVLRHVAELFGEQRARLTEQLAGARCVHTTRPVMHGGSKQLQGDGSGNTIKVTFIEKDGEEVTVDAPTGSSMLEVAHANDVELEGACEGSLACSTCHVIVEDESLFERMGEISDDENDMLDTAFGLTETSRLGCQITASSDLHGMRLRLPLATKNFAKH